MKKVDLKNSLNQRGAKISADQELFLDSLTEEINSVLEERQSAIGEIVNSRLAEMELSDEIASQVRELSEKIAKNSTPEFRMSDTQKRALMNVLTERKSEIVEAIRTGRDLDLFEIRVAAPHQNNNGTVSLGVGVTYPTVENFDESSVFATIRTPENFIFELILNRQSSNIVKTRIKTEQAPKEGSVAVVSEANAKPLVQYKWVKNAIERKKYAGRIEWTEEFEMDNGALFTAIVKMIQRDVVSALNNGIYNDIITNATAYTSSPQTGNIVLPNLADVATVLQGLINSQNYNADVVAINPTQLVDLLLTKKADGEYLFPKSAISDLWAGMKIVTSSTVSAGYMLVFDSSIYTEEHTGIIVRVGQYNDQFIKNSYTLIAEQFSLLDVAKIDLVASYYGAIATISADIKKP